MEEQDNRKYLSEKIHPIFEKLLIELLITKPTDPVEFMNQWLLTQGQQFRPKDKQHLAFAVTVPVVSQQQANTPSPRRSIGAQSLQNQLLKKQHSNQFDQNQIGSNRVLSQKESQFESQINSQQQINTVLQKQMQDQSEILKNSKELENSQEEQASNIDSPPQDQKSNKEESKNIFFQKQISLQPQNFQQNKLLKKSQTQSNPLLLQPFSSKIPQPQLGTNNTPKDMSLAQMKSSVNNSHSQIKLNQSIEDQQIHQSQQIQQYNQLQQSQQIQDNNSHISGIVNVNQSNSGQAKETQQLLQQITFKPQEQQLEKQKSKGETNKIQTRIIPKNREQKQKILKKINQQSLFNHLNEEEKENIVMAMEEKKFKTNDIVIKQGDDGELMYLVEQGLLDCTKRIQKGEDKFIKSYQPGELFGELALLYNDKRAASITAKTECLLWALDQQTFDTLIKASNLRKIQQFEQVLDQMKILDQLDQYVKKQIAQAVVVQNFQADETVFNQGDKGDYFYLIQQGTLRAYKSESEEDEEQQEVYVFNEFDYFGELAMLKEIPRQATIKCDTNCILLGIDRQTFKKLLIPIHETLKHNADRYNLSQY